MVGIAWPLTSLVVRSQMRGQETLHDSHVFGVPFVGTFAAKANMCARNGNEVSS